MPEGDTVYKIAAYLQPLLGGRRLLAGSARASPTVDLAGSRVEQVFARGKHLFIALDRQRLLRSHLGMRGSWHGYAPDEPWQRPRRQASIVLDIGERVLVCFNAKQVELLRRHGVRDQTLAVTLGPDLMDPAVDYPLIVARARTLVAATTPVADLLLDQRVGAGIGNVYKSEVLFLERRHPATPVGSIDAAGLERLYRRAARLLRDNTGAGPRITRRANDQAGRLWVYGRTGRPCLRCDQTIRALRLGRHQRSTFWCPGCQPPADL